MTAVNWLDEQLQDTMYFVYGYTDGVRKVTIPLEDYMKFKQEALELEKEQIKDAYANAVMKENNSDYIGMHEQSSAEIYFIETYGSKGSDETLKDYHIVDTNKMVSSQTEISDEIFGQELFNYFTNQHNISLLQSEMHDIIDIVKKMEQTEISDEEIEEAVEQKYPYKVSDTDIKGMIISAQRGAWTDAIKWYREQLKQRQ